MTEFWAVIGDGGAGKSSLIRALTGAGNIGNKQESDNRQWNMAYVGLNAPQHILTFVQGASLQEVPKLPIEFVNWVKDSEVNRVIVALRINESKKGGVTYPDAATYLKYFIKKAGWTMNGSAQLDVLSVPGFPAPIAVAGRQANPANQSAAALRAAWGIL